MKKIIKSRKIQLKMLYWGLVIIGFICLILPILFFINFFNPNKLQNLINNRLISKGYSIKLRGKVNPYIWNGLNIELNNVDFYKDKHLLAHFNYIHSELSWLKLIVGKAVISKLLINGAQVDLTKTNWANIINPLQKKDFNTTFDNTNTIDILDINSIKQSKSAAIFNNANLHLSNTDAKHNLILQFTVPKYKLTLLTGALISVDNNNVKLNAIKTIISSKELILHLDSQATYNLEKPNLLIYNLSGSLNYNQVQGMLHAEELSMDGNNTIKIKNLHYLADLDNASTPKGRLLSIDANQIISTDSYQFKSSLVNLRYSSEINSTTSIHTLSTLTNLNLDIESEQIHSFCNNVLQISNSNDMMQPYTALLNGECSYDYKQKLLDLALSGQLNDSAIQIDANYLNIANPHLHLKAKLNTLTLNQKLISQLPNKLDLFHNKELLPFNNLFNLKLDSEISIKKLYLGNTAFNNFATKISINESQISIENLQANYHQGALAVKAKINKYMDNIFNISLWQKFTNIDLNNFFDDFFNIQTFSGGQSSIELNAQIAQVSTYNDLVKKFNGTVNISAKNGSFQGLNINYLLAASPTASLVKANSTLFTHLSSSWVFKNGVSTTNKLNFYSPYFFANGDGLINLAQSKINYNLNVHSNLPPNQDQIKSVTVAMNMHGELFSPEIYIESIHFYKIQPAVLKNKNIKSFKVRSVKKTKSAKKLHTRLKATKVAHIRKKPLVNKTKVRR